MSFTNVAANFHTFNNWNVGGRDFHLCKSVLTLRHATTASNGLETVRCCSSPYLGRHVRRDGGGGTLYGWINVSQGLQWAPKLPLLTKRVRQKWLPSKSTMTLKVTQNWFFFCMCYCWMDILVFVYACGKGVDDIYVMRTGSESPRRGENAKWEKDKKYINREAGFNPCSLRAGEIDGCIQDFYTPLIGFTGH